MSDILGWIRRMISLLIFLTLLLQILPNGNYRKYVKFFAGLIFVVTLLGPAVSLFTGENWEKLVLEVVEESGTETKLPDFEGISEKGTEISEKYTSELTEDLADE